MSNPSNPNYSVARTNPAPHDTPDHPFVPPDQGAFVPCWHVMFTLEDGWPVRCGQHLSHHPPRAHQPGEIQPKERSDWP